MKTRRRIGSRAQVYHGKAETTAGGLRKEDLIKNKRGRIVPASRHNNGLVLFTRRKV
jgi:hypothetical protein